MKEVGLADALNLTQLLKIMKAMRENDIAYVELPGLKLSLAPTKSSPATNSRTVTSGFISTAPDTKEAFAAMEKARAATVSYRQDNSYRQDKLSKLRAANPGGITSSVTPLINKVYKEALAVKAPKVDFIPTTPIEETAPEVSEQ